MAHNEAELSRKIKGMFRLNLPDWEIDDAFPHVERPSLAEMEFAINAKLQNIPVAMEIEAKLNRKPTWEMLNEFTRDRGLSWERDTRNGLYQFRIQKFYGEV